MDVCDMRPAKLADAAASGLSEDQMRHELRAAKSRGKTLFAWVTRTPRAVAPLAVKGQLGLFDVTLG